MDGRTIAIVQARMSSRRLPGKVLAQIAGKSMVEWVVQRVAAADTIDEVWVATGSAEADDPLVAHCERLGIHVFRGSESNVLDRFRALANEVGAATIVRITADCPLLDPGVVDRVVRAFDSGPGYYASNTLVCTYPDGLDVEVFSRNALEEAWTNTRSASDREHVTPYIRRKAGSKAESVAHSRDLSDHRWTVDDHADLAFVRAVYERILALDEPYRLESVLSVLDRLPHVIEGGPKSPRNEGYYRGLVNEEQIQSRPLSLEKSAAIMERAARLVPSCTQTFSKGPTQFVQGGSPMFFVRGQGSRVWDPDGNEFIDYPMGLGALILGHDHPTVRAAVEAELRNGTTFSLPHPLEVDLAERLSEVVPSCEMVRFGKNGSDATSGAVRLARAHTGRDIIACCGYHGWQDWYIGTTTRAAGVPEAVRRLTVPFRYNDLDSLVRIFRDHRGDVACVIMEPVGIEEPEDGFLEAVRELASAEGALLIFDEMITGFRLHPGGAQTHYGLYPDLSCFGKALANGFPLSAITGRAEVMRQLDDIFYSFTFGGETIALAAAVATLDVLASEDVFRRVWEYGRRLKDGYNVLSAEYGLGETTECVGLPPRTVVLFNDNDVATSFELKSFFQQECHSRGILFAGSQMVSAAHTEEDIDYTLMVYRSAFEELQRAVEDAAVRDRLVGEPVRPVFRQP